MTAFIPKPYKKEAITIRIDCECLQKIDDLILHEYSTSRSELINQCVQFALANLDTENDNSYLGDETFDDKTINK